MKHITILFNAYGQLRRQTKLSSHVIEWVLEGVGEDLVYLGPDRLGKMIRRQMEWLEEGS